MFGISRTKTPTEKERLQSELRKICSQSTNETEIRQRVRSEMYCDVKKVTFMTRKASQNNLFGAIMLAAGAATCKDGRFVTVAILDREGNPISI